MAVLVVDDDRKTVDLVRLYLERAGFTVRAGYDGRKAIQLAREYPPGLASQRQQDPPLASRQLHPLASNVHLVRWDIHLQGTHAQDRG